MGRTSCCFRDCKVNNIDFPEMHFFKYPMRFKDRYDLWIKYSNNYQMYNLKDSQVANRVICARHFRDNCFMNYRKDRLCPTAIPTITKISSTMAFDYENLDEEGEPQCIVLQPPTMPHLIPPKDFKCPLGLEDSSRDEAEKQNEVNLNEERNLGLTANQTCENLAKITKTKYEMGAEDKAKLLAAMPPKKPKLFTETENSTESAPIAEVTVGSLSTLFPESSPSSSNSSITSIGMNSALKFCDINQLVNKMFSQFANGSSDSMNTLDKLKKIELENAKLRKDYEKMQAKCTTLEQQQLQHTAERTSEALSKAQAFHGVQKYISSSMSTLLRMEMFSVPDRVWKPDERLLCTELLQLGENVYNYLIDEWRFRLPSVKLVRKWIKQPRGSGSDSENGL